jgi:hypothetical protein
MAVKWTLETLKAKSPEERFTIWQNAKRLGTAEALDLVRFIETSGLDYAPSGGMSRSDPRALEMEEIIQSPEGRAGCLRSTEDGRPALAGVEPLIVAKMGARYGAFSQMTQMAGRLVGDLMLSLGYEVDRQADMPAGSVAQSATIWRSVRR